MGLIEHGGQKEEVMKFDLDIQFFAEEDNEDVEVNEMGDEEGADYAPILTFDELMTDKYYQSEFDKRMTKAQETATEKHKKEIEELKEFKTQFEKTQSELEEIKQTADKTKQQLKMESEIQLAIVKAGAKDEIAVKAHLNEIMNNEELGEQEKVAKVQEKLADMQKQNSYLFGGNRATSFELGKGSTEDGLQSIIEKSMGVK